MKKFILFAAVLLPAIALAAFGADFLPAFDPSAWDPGSVALLGSVLTLPLTDKMQSFNSVAAGQTANLRCEIGYTYQRFHVAYSGVTLAQMTGIRLKANGDTIRDWTGGAADIDAMNQFDGLAAAAGILTINCERYAMTSRPEREFTAIGTGMPLQTNMELANYNPKVIETLSLEIDISAAAAAPVLTAYAERTGPGVLGRILQLQKFAVDVTATGDKQIDWIPRGAPINRIFFKSANITAHVLKINGRTVQDRTKALNDLFQVNGVRTPQAGWYVLDFTELGDGIVGLDTNVNDLRIILTMSATGTFPVFVERVGRL